MTSGWTQGYIWGVRNESGFAVARQSSYPRYYLCDPHSHPFRHGIVADRGPWVTYVNLGGDINCSWIPLSSNKISKTY